MQTCAKANDLKFCEIKFFKVIYFMVRFNGFFRSIRVCIIIAIRIGFRFSLVATHASVTTIGVQIVKVLFSSSNVNMPGHVIAA